MSLNLITDPWIPSLRDGERVTIRPDQIAEPGITAPAWQRADFNLACLELLIGLVSMADPPRDDADWRRRTGPIGSRASTNPTPVASAKR